MSRTLTGFKQIAFVLLLQTLHYWDVKPLELKWSTFVPGGRQYSLLPKRFVFEPAGIATNWLRAWSLRDLGRKTLDVWVRSGTRNVVQRYTGYNLTMFQGHLLLITFSPLQVIVWGDYGRMDRKVFMGVVQILLDELDLSNLVIGWYKLFSTSSMCDPPLPSSSSPLGGSPKKSPGPSPRSSMNQGVASPMRGASPLPTIIPPPGHMHNMDEEGDYVWVRRLLLQSALDSA